VFAAIVLLTGIGLAIEDTLRRYLRALDDSDLEAYLATLTDDAQFISAESSYAGKEAIRKYYVEPVLYLPSQIAPIIEVYYPVGLHNLLSQFERETREAIWH